MNIAKNYKPILLFFILAWLIVSEAHCQNELNLFNTIIPLGKPLTSAEIPTSYPYAAGAASLIKCSVSDLNSSVMTQINSAVRSRIPSDIPSDEPVFFAFFTSSNNTTSNSINLAETHAICLGLHADNQLKLYYFENGASGDFKRIGNIGGSIGELWDGLFVTLHYAYFGSGDVPEASAMFILTGENINGKYAAGTDDVCLEISKDHKRQQALDALALSDSLVLTGLDHVNGTIFNCGDPCPVVLNTSCWIHYGNGNTTYECRKSPETCAANSVHRAARDLQLDLGIPFRYKEMRDFRDRFMSLYCEGRTYTGYYYAFSRYMKLNPFLLWKYASVLLEFYTVMELLADSTTNQIIVTASLRSKVLEILEEHADAGDDYFQTVLGEVKKDLDQYEGLTRSELISRLSEYGICSESRMKSPDRSPAACRIFYDNQTSGFIVYSSMPGQKVTVQLYSTASLAVMYSEILSDRQKFNILIKDIKPGIYICRLTSCSGHEEIIKVPVFY